MQPDSNREESLLDAAWLALDDGQHDAALGHLADVSPQRGERYIVELYIHLERGERPLAERALEQAGTLLEESDPILLAAHGQWHLSGWQIGRARAFFERAVAIDRDPSLLERLSLCADLEGDFELADELLHEMERLDPEGPPAPARLQPEAFERVVADAAADLEPEFRAALEEIAVVIDPVPTRELVEGGELAELPPDLLGLFVGPSALDRSHDVSAELPPTIFLFQRNLERACIDTELLREEIRVTLYHELAHALGFDEDGVAGMGLE